MKMNSMLGAVCASVLSLSISHSAVAAFIIDDFNVNNTSTVTDNLVGGGAVTGPSGINGPNIVMEGAAGWSRSITADLTAGDSIETEICQNCNAGHVNMGAGNGNGVGTVTYTGGTANLSSYTHLGFEWGATEAGASVDVIFTDGTNTATVASWSPLADTGGSAPGNLVTQALMNITFGAVNASAITGVQFVVTGVPNMNSIFDNLQASVVPVPAAVWLFGSGLLGLIGVARKKSVEEPLLSH